MFPKTLDCHKCHKGFVVKKPLEFPTAITDSRGTQRYTLPKTNRSPLKSRPSPKGNFIFQLLIFRGKLAVSFRDGVYRSNEWLIFGWNFMGSVNTYQSSTWKMPVRFSPTPLVGFSLELPIAPKNVGNISPIQQVSSRGVSIHKG